MKIDHIGLYVGDLEAAKDFFVKYFDTQASEMYHNPRKQFKSYFLSFGDGTRLEIMTRPDPNCPEDYTGHPGHIDEMFHFEKVMK